MVSLPEGMLNYQRVPSYRIPTAGDGSPVSAAGAINTPSWDVYATTVARGTDGAGCNSGDTRGLGLNFGANMRF